MTSVLISALPHSHLLTYRAPHSAQSIRYLKCFTHCCRQNQHCTTILGTHIALLASLNTVSVGHMQQLDFPCHPL